MGLCALAGAHDFWIEPEAFRLNQGVPLRVTLMVGDRGHGETVRRDSSRIVEFAAYPALEQTGAKASAPGSAQGTAPGTSLEPSQIPTQKLGPKPILGQDGLSPAGVVKFDRDGLWILGYRSNAVQLELEPSKFEAYLSEVGLESVSRARQAGGHSARPGRESYSRACKSLVHVGATLQPSQGYAQRLGYTLEISPVSDPFQAPPVPAPGSGAAVNFQVVVEFQGQPLEGASVRAMCLDAVAEDASGVDKSDVPHLDARTDANGRAGFALPRAGRWMLASVHMVPCADPERADWESTWSSLTLEIPAPR